MAVERCRSGKSGKYRYVWLREECIDTFPITMAHAQGHRGGHRNLQMRFPLQLLAVQVTIRAQEVAHGRSLGLLALFETHVATPDVQECIHSPLRPSVCLG